MSLKLFRSTGYSSILLAGETRVATHPGWVIAAAGAWAGFAPNVALWRALASGDGAALARGLILGVLVGGACAALLSLLGWRKTLKPATIAVLFLVALAAVAIWEQALAVDAGLLQRGLTELVVPSWASLLRWQTPTLLVALAVAPSVWVAHTHVRRLPGPRQLGVNLTGAAIAAALVAAAGFVLAKGLV
jgi:hypothetical protein